MMQEKKRNPFIAGLFSFLSSGLGFLYNGFLIKGIVVTLCYFLLEMLFLLLGAFKSFPFAVTTQVSLFGIWIYFIFYNASLARKIGLTRLKAFNRWYIYLVYLVITLVTSFFIDSNSGTESYTMSTGSMSPAIEEGERVIADKEFYRHREIKAGEVVLFRYPKNPKELFVKRCIALGSDSVEIRDGIAYVNNERSLPTLLLKRIGLKIRPTDLKDIRIFPPDAGNEDQYGPVVVPEGKIFVLGDCRDISLDSRFFGFVDREAVTGKVLYIWWSGDFSRIGKTVQ